MESRAIHGQDAEAPNMWPSHPDRQRWHRILRVRIIRRDSRGLTLGFPKGGRRRAVPVADAGVRPRRQAGRQGRGIREYDFVFWSMLFSRSEIALPVSEVKSSTVPPWVGFILARAPGKNPFVYIRRGTWRCLPLEHSRFKRGGSFHIPSDPKIKDWLITESRQT